MADKDKKYNEAEFEVGVKIEHEHQPTYDMIKRVLEETGKLPEAIEVFKGITQDHVNEFGQYYNDEVGLPNMERELKKTKPEEVKGGNTMERMNLEINGSIFNGMTDGRFFFFNAIDRCEMGDSVELARPEPIKAEVSVETQITNLFATVLKAEDKKRIIDILQKTIKADEVTDMFPASGEGAESGLGEGSGSGDAVITEPVAEEVGEIMEEKSEVEKLKDIKQDLKDAEKGVDEMIKHEGGEVEEELSEIAPVLGPEGLPEALPEPLLEEPMLAKKKEKRKFEVDPTEIGKKDLVKGSKKV